MYLDVSNVRCRDTRSLQIRYSSGTLFARFLEQVFYWCESFRAKFSFYQAAARKLVMILKFVCGWFAKHPAVGCCIGFGDSVFAL